MTSIAAVTQFLVLSEVDVGRESKVQVNGLTVVALEENPSTGYAWRYEQATGTQGLLELLTDSFLSRDGTPGAPGAHVFLFAAVQAGPTSLRFGLYPLGKPEPERDVTFDIEIVPAD